MAKTDVVKKKTQRAGTSAESDIYTALLGLAFMAMAGTTIWVCLKSVAYFDRIF